MSTRLLCAIIYCLSSIATGLYVSKTVPLFRLVEQKVKFSVLTNENPWAVQDCNADIRPPVGSRYASFMSLALFFDGRSQNTDTFAFRFVPDCPGSWNWTLNCSKLVLAPGEPSSGTVEAASSVHDGRGGVLRATKNPQFLEREDGSRWTPIGYEMDWLWALGLNTSNPTIAPVENALDILGSYGFNHFLVSLYSNYSAWSGSLPDSMAGHVWWAQQHKNTPWVASESGGLDYSQLNLRFLRHWDRVLDAADDRGLVIHMMLYVGNKNVRWPERLSADDDVYWYQVLARFAAHPAIILDVSKEAASYGVGKPYVLDRLALMHKMNAHGRLVTAHSGLEWSGDCPGCNLTLVSAQMHTQHHTDGSWYWGIRDLLAKNPQAPVANVEFMYMAGTDRLCNGSAGHDCAAATPGGCGNDPSKYEQGHCADLGLMRHVMWGLYMALGSGAWYDCDTAWDYIALPPEDHAQARAPYRWMSHLSSFWDTIDPFDMEPCGSGPLHVNNPSVKAHCLRSHSHDEALIYLWGRASFTYSPDIKRGQSLQQVKGLWYNPLTGTNASFTKTYSPSHPLSFSVPDDFHGGAALLLSDL